MIKQAKAHTKNEHIAYLTGKNFEAIPGESEVIADYRKKFIDSKEDVDFLKLNEQFVFFVRETDNLEKLRKAGFELRKQLPKKVKSIYFSGEGDALLALVEGFALSNYQFLKYRTKSADLKFLLEDIYVIGVTNSIDVSTLNNVIKAVYWARDMVNEPVSFLTATQLSEELKRIGEESSVKVQVLEKSKIEAIKMGGLLAVNKGSIDPPTFTIMEYKPEKAVNKKPLVLVGKGVVYDTGGLSLKPTAGSMDIMKSDMGGAAAIAGAIYAAALNKLNIHVIGLVPATDNRPGLNAYAPGDVVTMYNETTVEVLNTDAEGRMILADALAYAAKFDPELVIDAATLTGAAVRAVGHMAACVMGNASEEKFNKLLKSGNDVHERMVRFPFWDDYLEELQSGIADLKNLGGPNAGMITAGKFLEQFVKAPYIHLDIAGPAWSDSQTDYKGKGGSGAGVRLLFNFMKNYN
jgi:leucyl aminopeptidase